MMPARRLMPPDCRHCPPSPQARPRRSRRPAVLMLGLTLLVTIAAGAGCRKKQDEGPRPASLKGKVVSANGRALPDVALRVLAADKLNQIVRDAKTAPDGTFSLDAIPPGRYLVRGELPGFSSAGVPVTLASGDAVSTVLRLEPVQLLEGTVQDAQGRPLAQAALFAWPLGGGGGGLGVVESKSGSDGRFALAGLAPGAWTVMVEAPGFGT